jgi:hypothetical protein
MTRYEACLALVKLLKVKNVSAIHSEQYYKLIAQLFELAGAK